MLGAIVGDIVGSIYEFRGAAIKTKDFPLFSEKCRFTDDTVMTFATAEALTQGGTPEHFTNAYKKYATLYPRAGYGKGFRQWAFSDDRQPYNSYGNGSAMRVSPCGWYFSDYDETLRIAETSAAVTHNHPEGIKGAQAVAAAIYMARNGKDKQEIKNVIMSGFKYNLSRALNDIRPRYRFDSSCAGSVPEAITAFLESESFEDAIRNAVSLGGDSDTLAAIAGSIAEAYYGVPDAIAAKALTYLDGRLRGEYNSWRYTISKQVI
ncbi:hypothetical protein FACS1894184_19400 [Clostridia bacterium]|nr:hypothetical protein FACS1894184_19400 [Clostridia bacterium]